MCHNKMWPPCIICKKGNNSTVIHGLAGDVIRDKRCKGSESPYLKCYKDAIKRPETIIKFNSSPWNDRIELNWTFKQSARTKGSRKRYTTTRQFKSILSSQPDVNPKKFIYTVDVLMDGVGIDKMRQLFWNKCVIRLLRLTKNYVGQFGNSLFLNL